MSTARSIALLTGASSGIGSALAFEYAAHGYDVVLVARRAEALAALANALTERHRVQATPLPQDLLEPGAAGRIAEELERRGMTIDALVNNAGFGVHGAFLDTDPTREVAMIQLNVAVLTELTKRFVPGMVARRGGHVLNIASTAAFQPGPFMAVYCATKAYVLSFSEALSEELRGTGVTVTALCPGATESEFARISGNAATKLFRNGHVMSAEEVARIGYQSAARGERLRIAGVRNAFLAKSASFAPRGMVLRIARDFLSIPPQAEVPQDVPRDDGNRPA